MDENYNANNEQVNEQQVNNNKNLPKFKCFHEEHPVWSMILVGLCVILGSYLATCWMLHKHITKAFNPYKEMQKMEKMMQKERHNMDKMEKFAQREFDRIERQSFAPIKKIDNDIIDLDEEYNSYIISVDLKPFDNNEKNVQVYINNGYITIEGKNEADDKYSSNLFSMSQSYRFPRPVDFDNMTQRIQGDKLIITVPYSRTPVKQ